MPTRTEKNKLRLFLAIFLISNILLCVRHNLIQIAIYSFRIDVNVILLQILILKLLLKFVMSVNAEYSGNARVR